MLTIKLSHKTFQSSLPPCNVGTRLVQAELRLFETQSLTTQEGPNRMMRNLDAAFNQHGLQATHCQIRRGLDRLCDEITMGTQLEFVIAANFSWGNASFLAIALMPFDH